MEKKYFIKEFDDEGNEFYVSTTKLKNGQTARIEFDENYYKDRFTIYNVSFIISNKKKQMNFNKLLKVSSGKSGLEGLIWAKNKILEFEKFIKEKYPNEKIIMQIFWDDNKRRDAYSIGLKKYGYTIQYRFGVKGIYKDL